jgi:PAS domain S-box-containing protein
MSSSPGADSGRGPLDNQHLGPRFHIVRMTAAAFVVVVMTAFGLVRGMPSVLFVAVIAGVVAGHAFWCSRRQGTVFESLLVDTTGVMAALALLAPPAEAGLAPVVAITVSAVLFLDDRRALLVAASGTIGVSAVLAWNHTTSISRWSPAESVWLVALSVVAVVPLMWWLLKQANRALSMRRRLEETLQEKESRYRTIAENVSDAIVTTDPDGVIAYCNPAVERIFGHEPADLIGQHLEILIPERFRHLYRRGLRRYVETGLWVTDWRGVELIGQRHDGTELNLEVSFGESFGPEGRRFIGTIRDVTDRLEADTALRASEARYRGLFEGVPVGVYRTGRSGEILDANPMLAELLGYDDPADVIGCKAQDFYVDPTDRDVWQHRLEGSHVLRGHEIQLRRPDGTTIWLRDSGRELRDATGEVVGYEGTLEDITERRFAEERLQAMVQAQRHRLLYEKALSACSHALLVGSDDRALEVALQALLEATGVNAVFVERNHELPEVGLVTDLLYEVNTDREPPDYERWRNVPWSDMPVAYSYLSRGEPYAFGVRDLEGRERELYEAATTKSELDIPIMIGDEWVGLIGFADFEKERPWRSDEIALLATVAQMIGSFWEKQRAHQKLQDLVHYKDEFVASVSHELRTPLTAVVGLSEELAGGSGEGFSGEELKEFYQLIAQQSREVAYIVEDLLVAARVEIETVSIDVQPVDLDAEVAATVSGWPSEFGDIVHRAGGVKVEADPTRFRQITRNLLTNAIRYGGSDVVVVTQPDGDVGVLQVRDNGRGVDPEDLERIFEPYERASDVEIVRPGSVGLGLYVSRQLARLMGGDLTCRREDGETVFELSLPKL